MTQERTPTVNSPFPWPCPSCASTNVIVSQLEYNADVRHDGRLYSFTVPHLTIPVCQSCGELIFTDDVDLQINDALRRHLTLLTPTQIRTALDRLDITQKELADRLDIAEATISRWLNNIQIQSRSLDKLLRLFFAFPCVRQALPKGEMDPTLGTIDIPDDTPEAIERCLDSPVKSSRYCGTPSKGPAWNVAADQYSEADKVVRRCHSTWSVN